ncbi:MAG: Integral rane protein [Haloplasmataceae bacterium]|jgi:hypothetical integral membrane protein (TIGR02206 family)|nr:Integral rane protein [Haloplasmataceae bacterium]
MLNSFTNFLRNFFGPGIEGYSFPYFTLPHFLPIIIMILLIFILYKFRDYIRNNEELDMKLRAWLGFIVALANISWYWHAIHVGTDISVSLPLTICETVMFMSVILLFTKNQHMFDVFYFWTICGSLQALITPAVLDQYGPSKFKYYQFWTGHCGIFIVIFYCLFILQMKVNLKSMFRAIIWLLIMGVVAIYANSNIPDANYLYLSGSEKGGSILDILPTYLPVRFSILFTLVLLLFTLAYIPWFFINKKERLNQNKLVINLETI